MSMVRIGCVSVPSWPESHVAPRRRGESGEGGDDDRPGVILGRFLSRPSLAIGSLHFAEGFSAGPSWRQVRLYPGWVYSLRGLGDTVASLWGRFLSRPRLATGSLHFAEGSQPAQVGHRGVILRNVFRPTQAGDRAASLCGGLFHGSPGPHGLEPRSLHSVFQGHALDHRGAIGREDREGS